MRHGAARLEMALLEGSVTVQDLQQNDIGRESIMPLLQNQHQFCNLDYANEIVDLPSQSKEQVGETKSITKKDMQNANCSIDAVMPAATSNRDTIDYGYGCLNGTPIPDRYLHVISLEEEYEKLRCNSDAKGYHRNFEKRIDGNNAQYENDREKYSLDIILASDGYPELKSTLEESEQALHKILEEDPLLFRQFKSTKGKIVKPPSFGDHSSKKTGATSFDDRTYVRIRTQSQF